MVQLPQDFIDECFIEEYKKLDDYLQIPNMDKLRGIIASFKDNEKFVFISGLDYSGNSNIDKYNPKLYDEIGESLGKLGYIFNNSKLSSISVDSIFDIIELSCVGDLRRELSSYEKEKKFFVVTWFIN